MQNQGAVVTQEGCVKSPDFLMSLDGLNTWTSAEKQTLKFHSKTFLHIICQPEKKKWLTNDIFNVTYYCYCSSALN